MSDNGKPQRFSAAERDLIVRSAVGQPTGVVVTIGGFDFDLVPLTVEQGTEIGEMIDSLQDVAKKFKDGRLTAEGDVIAAAVGKNAVRIPALMREVLHQSAIANGLIDENDSGEAVFDEWFAKLPLVPTLQTLLPKVITASGMTTTLGNPSTPPPESA